MQPDSITDPARGHTRSEPWTERRDGEVVVIGAGVAGLRAAIAAAERRRVLVLAKDSLTDSNTRFAQGGIAVALSDEDRVGFHLEDTLKAGAGLSDPRRAEILVEEGVTRVEELLRWGAEFDRTGGRLVFGLEGAHSRRRVLHAGGDSTGQEIVRTLLNKARRMPRLTFLEHAFTLDLVVDESGRCRGLLALIGRENPALVYFVTRRWPG